MKEDLEKIITYLEDLISSMDYDCYLNEEEKLIKEKLENALINLEGVKEKISEIEVQD